MRASLARWIGNADALRHLERFRVAVPDSYAGLRARADDYYLSLVGELFERLRENAGVSADWARLGNAFAQVAEEGQGEALTAVGIDGNEALLFSAASFYCGDFPASAYLTLKGRTPGGNDEATRACFDFLARPGRVTSATALALTDALRRGDMRQIETLGARAMQDARAALELGPNAWIPARLLEKLVGRFRLVNVRAVLPDGNSEFWTPLVSSLLNRASWEFFPSQIDAIRRGFLDRTETFSLQMPTGAGKTTLSETLLYWHLNRNPNDVAILLVPFRALAAELRTTLVKRLNRMGISARCAYGGTVPVGDEVRGLDDVRAMVATPEAISGVLSADPSFLQRVSLVICDEGHLLDGEGRGIGLELLLARLKAREIGAPRFVFVSAIVPNIEEINAWLGGTDASVVRSDYRPALAEFAVLRISGKGASATVALDMHPHEAPPTRFAIAGFLHGDDFGYTNADTGRRRTFSFASIKTQAIAAARKALPMGAVAVFAANKRGDRGAVGLAEELLEQLDVPLPLPAPIAFARAPKLRAAISYLEHEYGADWLGTRALAAGAILHHGDIPQETREVIESLLRAGDVRFAICTSTLAEGVNLPIRTLVLYSVQRLGKNGRPENLLTRDIKNLVGRAGRAGSTTKGLVICANAQQWPLVEEVARQAVGEKVTGALRALLGQLSEWLARRNATITNELLEGSPVLHRMIDGIDATLIDLAAEEVGEAALIQLAVKLADETFAAQQADAKSKKLLQDVFALRAQRVSGIRAAGRLGWVRETGTRARLLDSVESALLPKRPIWDDVTEAIDSALVAVLLDWAWMQKDFQDAVPAAYRLGEAADIDAQRQPFSDLVTMWLAGSRFVDMAQRLQTPLDDLLGVHTSLLGFVFQTIVEQGVALLGKLLESQGRTLSDAVVQFPEHLRFGVPTPAARVLAAGGVRHRSAAVALGGAREVRRLLAVERGPVFAAALSVLEADRNSWQRRLGNLVFDNTRQDLLSVAEEDDE
jgi:helicase